MTTASTSYHITGMSTDDKPSCPYGSTFEELDTGDIYIYKSPGVWDRKELPSYGYIWNTDTMAWQKSTGGAGEEGAVSVTNFPSQWEVTDKDSLQNYKLSDWDDSSDPSYYGYVDKDGNWYIKKLNDSLKQSRYIRGTSGYSGNWSIKSGLTYDYFGNIF